MKQLLKGCPFGREIADFLQETKKIINGQTVYKVIEKIPGNRLLRKGYQLYIDSESYDHLEIYDKRGAAKCVLNFAGEIIKSKTDNAMGRTIN